MVGAVVLRGWCWTPGRCEDLFRGSSCERGYRFEDFRGASFAGGCLVDLGGRFLDDGNTGLYGEGEHGLFRDAGALINNLRLVNCSLSQTEPVGRIVPLPFLPKVNILIKNASNFFVYKRIFLSRLHSTRKT